MTTTTSCGIDQDRIKSEGAHTAEVATWVGNGSVDCVRQPWGRLGGAALTRRRRRVRAAAKGSV